jgi:hypothetical protein
LSQRDYRNLVVRRDWYFAETAFSETRGRSPRLPKSIP